MIDLPPAWWALALHRALMPLFDWSCPGCGGQAPRGPCAGCAARRDPLPARRCPRCLGRPGRHGCSLCREDVPFLDLQVLGRYRGMLRTLVRQLKYRGRLELGLWAGRELAALLGPQPGWVVVPVPVHPRRRRERGYNQVEPVAWALARGVRARYLPQGLVRRRHAAPSYQRGRDARWAEAEGAFATGAELAGLRVWLVDDVVTSGATLWGAASALRAAGALEVRVAAVARAY